MSPEEKSLLERVAYQLEENRKILNKINRAYTWSLIMNIAYWVLVILIVFGAFFAVKPYFQYISGVSGDVKGDINRISELKELLNGL